MTREELNYIKDAFSQIIDDIAGNPDWYEAARAVASDLGTLERKLEEKISPLPSNLDEAAEEYAREEMMSGLAERAFKARAEEAALKAYPYYGGTKGWLCKQSRPIFIKGYEQAEKDTIERACEYLFKYYAVNIGEFKKAMEEE